MFISVPSPSSASSPPEFKCGPNEVYDENPTACYPEDLTCEMLFRGKEQKCYPGETSGPICKCLPGFVRNGDEDCVPPPQCEFLMIFYISFIKIIVPIFFVDYRLRRS